MIIVSTVTLIAYNRTNHAKPFTPSSAWSRGRLPLPGFPPKASAPLHPMRVLCDGADGLRWRRSAGASSGILRLSRGHPALVSALL
jgi:hypothetical protein